ncbi:MAG: HD family hydrolase [Myxococcota bacterium]
MNPSDDRAQALLRFIQRAERLEALPRTGWLVCGVTEPESVASHTYVVALIALFIADHIDEDVDVEAMLRMALLHDIAEAMLTDLPWPVKRFVGKETVADAEARAGHLITCEAHPDWPDALARYEAFDSLEARIVKAADRIQMLAKSLQYDTQRRGDTRRFWTSERNFEDFGIPLVAEVLSALRRHHDAGTWHTADFD